MPLKDRRCKATTAKGEPCRAPSHLVDPVELMCPAHLDPEANALNARRGGVAAARQRARRPNPDALGELETVADAQRWLQQVALWITDRKLSHAEGKAIQGTVSAWLRAHETRVKVEQVEGLREEVRQLREARAAGDGRDGLRAVS